jgi:hypothetical protein
MLVSLPRGIIGRAGGGVKHPPDIVVGIVVASFVDKVTDKARDKAWAAGEARLRMKRTPSAAIVSTLSRVVFSRARTRTANRRIANKDRRNQKSGRWIRPSVV